MANTPEQNKEVFTDTQLEAITTAPGVYEAGTDRVNLNVAETLGLITKETRELIEAQLKNHENLFRAAKQRILTGKGHAVEKAATPTDKNAVAIRLAFEQVYGKFLFTETYKGTDPQHGFGHHFEHGLHHKLKFEIKEEDGIKGRNELLAARRRLFLLNAKEMTDPAKKAEADRRKEGLEKEIAKLEKFIATLDKVKNTPAFTHATLFKLVPALIKFVEQNKDTVDSGLVTTCELYKMAFDDLLAATGLNPKSKKAEVDCTRPEFVAFKTAYFDIIVKELADFAEKELPKKKEELAIKEETLHMADYSIAAEVMAESFTVTKALTSEEKAKSYKEAIDGINALTPPTTDPSGKVAAKITKIKDLAKDINSRDNLVAAVALLREIRGFSDKGNQEKIDKIVDDLEKIIVISGAVAVGRAEARLKDAKTNVEKAEKAREYFSTKNHTADIQTAAEELMAQTKDGITVKEVIDPKGKKTTDVLKYDELGIRPTIGGLQAQLDRMAKGGKGTNAIDDAKESARIKTDITALEDLLKAAQKTYNLLVAFTENVVFLAKNDMLGDMYDANEIKKIHKQLQGLDPSSSNVSATQLNEIFEKVKTGNFFNIYDGNPKEMFAEKIASLDETFHYSEKDLQKKKEALHAIHDLSDTEAAKRIIFTVVKRQHPKMSQEDQRKLVDLILADDVARIQTKKSYADLAREGSEDLKKLVEAAGEHDFKWKIIKFKYQEGGKVVEPFKDLKPGDLNIWAKIEKQFDIGKLDYKGGFFLLAAMAEFFGDSRGTFTEAYKKLEDKLKELIVEQLGVKKRMGEPYIRTVVDEAFDKQFKRSKALVRAHFDHYDKNHAEINTAKIKELRHRLKELDEKRRLKKVSQEVYEEKMAKILKEAKEYGVEGEIGYVQDSAMRGYMNSPQAQWLRDRGVDIGRYGKDKALAVAQGTAITGLNGVVGATKLGAAFTWQAAMTPLRLAKYPVLLAAKPLVGFVNLFRQNKLTIPGIGATAKQDAGRVLGYFKTKGTETSEGIKKKTAEAFGKPWAAAQYKTTKYADRSKVHLDEEAARIKELADKADLKPLEIAHAPSIDFAALRAEIMETDKQFGVESKLGKAPASHVIENGSKPPENAPEAPDAPAEKPAAAEGGAGHGHP
jgi:hypothetical protein